MLGQSFFKKNRKKFSDRLPGNTIAVVFSGREIPCSGDSVFPFKVDNNFYYLTGMTEPEGILTVYKDREGNVEERLFIPLRDADKAKFVGTGYTKDQAARISGLTNIAYDDEAQGYINEKIGGGAKLGYDRSQAPHQWYYTEENTPPVDIEGLDLSEIFLPLRLVKEPEEIEAIQRAIDLTALGLNEILAQIHPGMKEYELAALFEYVIKKNGAKGVAFDTIAASGPNATTLHYVANDRTASRHDLILFDLGAKSEGYCADVSRTYPVSGKMTLIQERFYNALLEAQKEIIKLYRAGANLKEINDTSKEIVAAKLEGQGIRLPEEGIQEWYYHSVGHSLGLDTHDGNSRDLTLEDGMVITCEPGVYAKEFGLGIRIEDDVLINGDEPIVLTEKIPKDLKEIMRLIN